MRRATTRKRRRRDRRRRRRRRRRFSRSEFFDSNASRHVQLGCFLRANKTRLKAFFIVVLSSRRRHHRATMVAATRVILEDVRGRRRRRRHDDPFAAARSLWRLREYFLYLKDTNFPHKKHRKHKDARASTTSALPLLPLLLQPSTARGETVRIVLQNERFEKTVRGSVFEPLGVQRVRSKTSPRRSESSRGATKLDRTDRVFVREEQRHDV